MTLLELPSGLAVRPCCCLRSRHGKAFGGCCVSRLSLYVGRRLVRGHRFMREIRLARITPEELKERWTQAKRSSLLICWAAGSIRRTIRALIKSSSAGPHRSRTQESESWAARHRYSNQVLFRFKTSSGRRLICLLSAWPRTTDTCRDPGHLAPEFQCPHRDSEPEPV